MAAERYASASAASNHFSGGGQSNDATIPGSSPSARRLERVARHDERPCRARDRARPRGVGAVDTARIRAGSSVGFVNVCMPASPRGQKTTSPGASCSSSSRAPERRRPAQHEEHLLHAVVRVQVEARRAGQQLVERRPELLRAERAAEEARADAHLLGDSVPRLVAVDAEPRSRCPRRLVVVRRRSRPARARRRSRARAAAARSTVPPRLLVLAHASSFTSWITKSRSPVIESCRDWAVSCFRSGYSTTSGETRVPATT